MSNDPFKRNDKFLSRVQVRDRYGIGHTTLYDWVEEYGFPEPYRMGPRLTRWKLSELEIWEAKQKESESEVVA